jgi:hypothetical protein
MLAWREKGTVLAREWAGSVAPMSKEWIDNVRTRGGNEQFTKFRLPKGSQLDEF